MRVHRLISILLFIEAKGKVKAKEIADELETSQRTIYRDINILCEAGIPIVTETGPNGGIHFVDGYKAHVEDLNEQDIMNIYLAGLGLKADSRSDMNIKMKNAFIKLQQNLSDERKRDLDNIKKRFYSDDVPWWGEKDESINIDIIVAALLKMKKLKIVYQKANGEVSTRIIRPYGIVINENNWYIVSYCEKSKGMRTFRFDRIKQCVFLEEQFFIPEGFSVKKYWQRSKSSFIDKCNNAEKYLVTLKIKNDNEFILKELNVEKQSSHQNYIEAVVNMYKYENAKQDIMKYICFAEVLEPLKLREYVINKIDQISDIYNK